MSHDMEDIIAVLDGRPELFNELKNSPLELQQTIAMRFRKLLEVEAFLQSIPGHLPGDAASQQRVPRLMQLLRETAKLE